MSAPTHTPRRNRRSQGVSRGRPLFLKTHAPTRHRPRPHVRSPRHQQSGLHGRNQRKVPGRLTGEGSPVPAVGPYAAPVRLRTTPHLSGPPGATLHLPCSASFKFYCTSFAHQEIHYHPFGVSEFPTREKSIHAPLFSPHAMDGAHKFQNPSPTGSVAYSRIHLPANLKHTGCDSRTVLFSLPSALPGPDDSSPPLPLLPLGP